MKHLAAALFVSTFAMGASEAQTISIEEGVALCTTAEYAAHPTCKKLAKTLSRLCEAGHTRACVDATSIYDMRAILDGRSTASSGSSGSGTSSGGAESGVGRAITNSTEVSNSIYKHDQGYKNWER